MDKLFLIDGHALVFKMYYAFLRRPMINSKGADMSILYGFTKYLLELIAREELIENGNWCSYQRDNTPDFSL